MHYSSRPFPEDDITDFEGEEIAGYCFPLCKGLGKHVVILHPRRFSFEMKGIVSTHDAVRKAIQLISQN